MCFLHTLIDDSFYIKGVKIMSIKIVTDSTSYLPESLCKLYDISIVSLNVIMDGVSQREIDLSNDTFYTKMAESREIPTSSQPIPEEMMETFESLIKQGHSILGIFISSEMSGTYANSHLMRDLLLEKYPDADIHFFDSLTNCMQMGFIAVEAAKAAQAGASMEEVLERCAYVRQHSRFVFTPEVLTYLQKGGRIGGAAALLGNFLQIKPILTVNPDGKTDVYTKVRTKKKAVAKLIEILLEEIGDKANLEDVIVHHINCEEEGKALAHALSTQLDKSVSIQSIGPVIGLHVGPGSIGIAYHYKTH